MRFHWMGIASARRVGRQGSERAGLGQDDGERGGAKGERAVAAILWS